MTDNPVTLFLCLRPPKNSALLGPSTEPVAPAPKARAAANTGAGTGIGVPADAMDVERFKAGCELRRSRIQNPNPIGALIDLVLESFTGRVRRCPPLETVTFDTLVRADPA